MTTRDVLATGRLPRHEIERLLMAATGHSRAEVAAGVVLGDEAARKYGEMCRRRLGGEPLQYIEGVVPFGHVDIAVDRRVLIPRPETERLWELACAGAERPAVIVDLATGSGALAVALAAAFPLSRVVASDVSEAALAVAAANAERNHVSVELFHGDLFDALPDDLRGAVDLLVSNPPYVAAGEFGMLPAEVRDWEPRMALVAGATGVEFVERIAQDALRWMSPSGIALTEIGETQGAAATSAFRAAGWRHVRLLADLTGRDRYVQAAP